MTSIPTRGIELLFVNILISSLWYQSRSAALSSAISNTQCFENSAKSGERSVVTLGSLCLLRYMTWKITIYLYFRFLGPSVTIDGKGICNEIDLPLLTQRELELTEFAFLNLKWREDLAMSWYHEYMTTQPHLGVTVSNSDFLCQSYYKLLECKPESG